MEQRKLTTIDGTNYLLREVVICQNGDTVWDVFDKQTSSQFVIHTSSYGRLKLTFFRNFHITFNCQLNSIKKVCEILLERNLTPTIFIKNSNSSLKNLFVALGFRKYQKFKSLYYLKNLK